MSTSKRSASRSPRAAAISPLLAADELLIRPPVTSSASSIPEGIRGLTHDPPILMVSNVSTEQRVAAVLRNEIALCDEASVKVDDCAVTIHSLKQGLTLRIGIKIPQNDCHHQFLLRNFKPAYAAAVNNKTLKRDSLFWKQEIQWTSQKPGARRVIDLPPSLLIIRDSCMANLCSAVGITGMC